MEQAAEATSSYYVASRGLMKSSEQRRVCRQRRGWTGKGEIYVAAEDKKIRDLRRSFALPTRQLKIDQKKNPKGLLELTAPKEESGANFIHFNILKSFYFCPGRAGGAKRGRRPDSDYHCYWARQIWVCCIETKIWTWSRQVPAMRNKWILSWGMKVRERMKGLSCRKIKDYCFTVSTPVEKHD